MKKLLILTTLSLLFIVTSAVTLAAGGGGGGGSGGSGGGSIQITPKVPVVEPPPPVIVPICSADEWSCQNWGACGETGRQSRTCSLKTDCSSVTTPKPSEIQICPGLKCGHLNSLRDRIECRLKLSNADLKKEFEILYFPEYCKVEETEEEKQECITLYSSFAPCWKMPIGQKRLDCAKKTIGYPKSLEAERSKCSAEKSTPRKKVCNATLNEKLEHFILFQMYDYEFQAESFYRQNRASLASTTAFDYLVETTKQQVEKTPNPKLWDTLLKRIKN